MSEQATVVAFKQSSGRVALRTGSSRFVLAEQTDSSALREGLGLSGNMSELGPKVWSDDSGQNQYEVLCWVGICGVCLRKQSSRRCDVLLLKKELPAPD